MSRRPMTLGERWRGTNEGLAIPAVLAFGLKAAGAILQFAVTLIVSRVLGADGAGTFFLALTTVMMATVLSRLGMDNTIMRFVAAARASGDNAAVRGAFREARTLVGLASLALAIVFVTFATPLSTTVFGKPDLATTLRITALAIVPMAISLVQAEALKGLGRVQTGVLVQSVIPWAVTATLVIALAVRWQVEGAAVALLAGYTVSALVAAVAWGRATVRPADRAPTFDRRELLRTSIPLLWVASINVVLNWAGSLFLGVWGTEAEVGIFNAAFRSAALISMVLLAVNSVIGPRFAVSHALGAGETLQQLLQRSTRLMTYFAVPAALVLIVAPELVLGMFGSEFRVGATALRLLAIGQFVNVAAGSLGKLLVMTGNEKVERNVVAASAIANVALNVALIPMYGLLGAAIAASASLVLRNLLAGIAIRKMLGLNPLSAWSRKTFRRAAAPAE